MMYREQVCKNDTLEMTRYPWSTLKKSIMAYRMTYHGWKCTVLCILMQIWSIWCIFCKCLMCCAVPRNPLRPFLCKVFRVLVTGMQAPSNINTLSGCSTVGLGANHPHPIQFLPVMRAVSFDPFSVTLCLPSCYDFSLLCPLLLFPPRQTTQMRNSRYWWTDTLVITLYVKPSKH